MAVAFGGVSLMSCRYFFYEPEKPEGLDKHKVHARWGMRYYTAYDNTGGKNVTLFGQDNVDKTTDKYHVTGYWSPQTGKDPEHDMD